MTTVLTGLIILLATPALVVADPANISGEAASDGYALVGEMADEASAGVGNAPAGNKGEQGSQPTEYRYTSVCATFTPSGEDSREDVECPASQQCTGQDQSLYRLWARTPPLAWAYLGAQCITVQQAGAPNAPRPRVTQALVLDAIRRIGLPTLEARTQPEDKTLVNFATIFYAEPEPFARTIALLGQSVGLEATPSGYTWHHGDGTTATTSTPGAPYPSKEITHSYTDAHVTVSPSVDVTYSARFRVNGGPWQDIDETVTIAGPASDLRISEATAVLSGDYG
ncbi:MAG: hypothetical protein ACRDOY_00885 [Nocardioidaceae bacterium]